MSTSSQEPRGPGLSSSLVTDFRAILSSLEQEKAARDPADTVAVPAGSTSGLAAASRPASPAAKAAVPPAERPAAETPAQPRSYGEVRERLAALGDVSDMLAKRPPAASTTKRAETADAGPAPRRRGFGTTPRQICEAEIRRKRGAPKDMITWQRVGALALFIAVVGGGCVVLQSFAAREEAKVAADVIGNAAVASVAPSAPVAPAPVEASVMAAPSAPAAEQVAATATSRGSIADALPPVLRDGVKPFQLAPTPVGVSAFASPAMAAPVPVEPADVAADVATALPKDVPLPPRAPARRAADEAPAAAEEVADEADGQAAFGGDPVGTATIRRSVTMRVAPKRGAAPIGNLSAGDKVELVGCTSWCEVIAEGKRGFIYKSFVSAGTSARADGAAESETAAQ